MSDVKTPTIEPEIARIFSMFFDGIPSSAEVIDTSVGDSDFRHTLIITTCEGKRFVLKAVSNDFTFPDKIRMWQRTVEEYIALGYYCPRIYSDKKGSFPFIEYHGKTCVVYAEEFSKYSPLQDRAAHDKGVQSVDLRRYSNDIWSMTAKIAARKLNYANYPSAYCLFETFCPSDETDEVMEHAMEWIDYALSLPEEFTAQVQRIWKLWSENRETLKNAYSRLPTSIFQADLNPTNLLVDDKGNFKGVYDFNLCGRDVFLNYLMRENHSDYDKEIRMIREALQTASKFYDFSDEERATALSMYRCLKPLWWVDELKDAGTNREKIKHCLDIVESCLTDDMDFKSFMG
ncbi:MAG: hypothetical protein J5890_00380 [Clostridia bacterium]|nr:hypothetical protein [Clostridia bacterium]